MQKQSKRNMRAQTIIKADGTRKTIFHEKGMPAGSYKEMWDAMNKAPRPNSKRQKKLRETLIWV